MTRSKVEVRLWLHTWLVVAGGAAPVAALQPSVGEGLRILLLGGLCACVGSLPALLVLIWLLEKINYLASSFWKRLLYLLLLQLLISLCYGLAVGLIMFILLSPTLLLPFGATIAVTVILFSCTCIAVLLNFKHLNILFQGKYPTIIKLFQYLVHILKNKTIIHMEHNTMGAIPETHALSYSNKILIKAVITGALILVMLIPTVFIFNLVSEREDRQKEVVAEVSNKWAQSQTITGPYIVVPYIETSFDENKKPIVIREEVIILPETLNMQGSVLPEKRRRSIYTVLLYRSRLNSEGMFKPVFPADIKRENLLLNEARICMGISDFKGIEEKVSISFNGRVYDLTPGLPTDAVDSLGLSCSAILTNEDLDKELPFKFNLKVKGSEQLHFVPLAGNSNFALQSSWPNPSFDGANLPTERIVNEQGFSAKWSFNKANLPFSTTSKDFKVAKDNYAFGLSMLQPADQYAKTSRSVKYAILFIGLTFSLFFIIELLQNKPVHPVQYILVGLALSIFYSLLLSLSEFILFNNAYLIAAVATVVLIALYAKGHFASWRIAGLFGAVLGSLYGFIFVLIQLEDTALLVGSIGLFVVIAVVMYASRKINWYHPVLKTSAHAV